MPQLLTRAEEYAMRVQASKQAKTGAKLLVKMGRKGSLPASAKIDLLARQDFEPDNSRIGCESHGIQTTLDMATLAAIWVYEWHTDLGHSMIRPYLPVAPILPTVPYVIVREAMANGYTTTFNKRTPFDTGKFPVASDWMRSKITPVQADVKPVLNVNVNDALNEAKQWHSIRTPKRGQRPQVLLPR